MNFQVVPETAQAPSTTSRQQPTARELARLAFLHPRLSTKKHAQLVLRLNGFSGGPSAVENLCASQEVMLNIRRTRRAGQPKPALSAGQPKAVTQRLADWRKTAVKVAAKQCLRHGAAGGHSMTVELTSDPSAVGYCVAMGSNRDTYGGSFKGWKAAEDHHTVTVPTDWRTRVLKHGLATLGGMLTLTAQQMISHGDVELFEATWVEQGRGFQAKVRHGTIARLGGESFHAENAQEATDGVLRKVKRAGSSPRRAMQSAYDLSTEAFIRRYRRYGDLDVSADDAYSARACEFGVRSWCERADIDFEEGWVILSRLLEGFAQSPLIEVRRTVLHVVAEHRARERLAAKRAAVVTG